MAKNETQYDKYLRNGKDIFDTYCSAEEKRPTMFPRVPQHKYIDLYPAQDLPGTGSFENDRNHQLNYEAEVKVYRALEKLDKNIIVLSSFEYSHFQYHLGDLSHDKKKCQKCKKMAANREGECDFVVIAPNCFVVIEVKNMGHIDPDITDKDTQFQALANTFKKSLQQRKNMAELIKRFSKRLTVLHFTAYPNFEKRFKNDFHISGNHKSTIIFKEDIDDFSQWWVDNVSDLVMDLSPELRTKREEVRNLFLAMWCTDKKKGFDKSKCSLGRCILNIDEQLRSGRFTFRTNNPEVFPTPPLYKNFLGVDNLTMQQYDLINSTEKFQWINGPAGAGKTVVLMAKILQLVLSDENNKAVLFNFTRLIEDIEPSRRQEKTLEKAGVKHIFICATDRDTLFTRSQPHILEIHARAEELDEEEWEKSLDNAPSELYFEILKNLVDHQVVIVVLPYNEKNLDFFDQGCFSADLLKKLWTSLQGINIFIDDFQVVMNWDGVEGCKVRGYVIIESLVELSKTQHIWVACDMVQCNYNASKESTQDGDSLIARLFNERMSSQHLTTMSKTLRNTYDLSVTLTVIREHIVGLMNTKTKFVNNVFPSQSPGHYIHGPKTVIHVLETNHIEQIFSEIFELELNKLYGDRMLDNNAVGLLHNFISDNILDKFPSTDIGPTILKSSYSAEWPAVIAVLAWGTSSILGESGVGNEGREYSEDLENLYLAISRARVKCTVIMYPFGAATLRDCIHLETLLKKLEDCADIRRYRNDRLKRK